LERFAAADVEENDALSVACALADAGDFGADPLALGSDEHDFVLGALEEKEARVLLHTFALTSRASQSGFTPWQTGRHWSKVPYRTNTHQ